VCSVDTVDASEGQSPAYASRKLSEENRDSSGKASFASNEDAQRERGVEVRITLFAERIGKCRDDKAVGKSDCCEITRVSRDNSTGANEYKRKCT
jgi:hypothetical protein